MKINEIQYVSGIVFRENVNQMETASAIVEASTIFRENPNRSNILEKNSKPSEETIKLPSIYR